MGVITSDTLDNGWLRLVGSLKLYISFAEYRLFYRALLQKRPIILRSLLTEATPYLKYTSDIQPIADRVAQNLEIISKTFSSHQNSAHGIYDEYQGINDKSHENPGTPGTKLRVCGNNLQILCHPICNWLYMRCIKYT